MSPSQGPEEVAAGAAFVCDCESAMRSACKGEPFYRELSGKKYCVLHFPGNQKGDAFKDALGRKLYAKDSDFRGVWFPDELSFADYTFLWKADFSNATFNAGATFLRARFGAADFSKATFKAEARFNSANFSGYVTFHEAIFEGRASFSSAVFDDSSFRAVTFNAEALFSHVEFKSWAKFKSAVFGGLTSFSASAFGRAVSFEGATFSTGGGFGSTKFHAEANFRNARFVGEANFCEATFAAETDFTSAVFNAAAGFASAAFGKRANFYLAQFKGEANFSSAYPFLGYVGESALYKGAQFNDEANFSRAVFGAKAAFYDAIFGASVSFLDATFNAEADFSDADFNTATADFSYAAFADYVRFSGNEKKKGTGGASSLNFQHTRIERPDRVFFHTFTLRAHWFVNVDSRGFHFVTVNWDGSLGQEIESLKSKAVSPPHKLLSIACRHLAVNAEENHRYEEASEFRYWSMDTRRRERRGFAFWNLGWWYWAASGYGERILRAFAVLIGVWLLFALLYTRVGFKLSSALTYSLGVMTLQKPDPPPATTTAQALVMTETILGPLQAALLALAIRRKFMY